MWTINFKSHQPPASSVERANWIPVCVCTHKCCVCYSRAWKKSRIMDDCFDWFGQIDRAPVALFDNHKLCSHQVAAKAAAAQNFSSRTHAADFHACERTFNHTPSWLLRLRHPNQALGTAACPMNAFYEHFAVIHPKQSEKLAFGWAQQTVWVSLVASGKLSYSLVD